MAANYDTIAGTYDFISRIVFGKALVESQVCLLPYVPDKGRLLIVGGGTGWILEALAKTHQQELRIDYVESSAKMIARSQKRNCGTHRVNFIHTPVEHYNAKEKYDTILTAFFFDNFQATTIRDIFTRLDLLCNHQGIWLYVDFVYDKRKSPLWQKSLLKLMYFFFRVTSRIETKELLNMDFCFSGSYAKTVELSHYSGFIKSIVYKKIK
ncbi:MAG TPA: class I SAM-dependent methyltransferase [Agriterribacter sp.]|nr:class I SAM-dependent methyltransferase [Agriterribacter sp.]